MSRVTLKPGQLWLCPKRHENDVTILVLVIRQTLSRSDDDVARMGPDVDYDNDSGLVFECWSWEDGVDDGTFQAGVSWFVEYGELMSDGP